jgi:hypothetical protein
MLHKRLDRVDGLLRARGYRWRHGDLRAERLTFAPSAVVTSFCVLSRGE